MRHAPLSTIALFIALALPGCDRNGASGGTSGAAGSASAPAASASAKKEDPGVTGTYRAAWGDTVFVQKGSAVTATYPGGSLTCTAAGDVLDCGWKEGSASGKALLIRQPDGSIKGNWGNGASPTDGGQWTFSPKK